MTKTLAELETIVRFRGDFRNVQRFPSANVQGEIQAAFNEFYEIVADTNQGYFDTTANASTTANVDFVALPSGTWRVRAIDRLDGSDWIALSQIGINERNRFSSTTDEPVAYQLVERGANLYPTPNAVYTLRVTYTPVAPTLGAAREYYNGWEEYAIFGALVRIALNERRDASEWQQQLNMQRERIVRGASGRRSGEPEYLPLHDGAGPIDREFGWWW